MIDIITMRNSEQTEGLLNMIKDLGDTKDMTMIEIGSYVGESTIMFAENFKKVISIDPFLNYFEKSDKNTFDLNNLDEVFNIFKKNTSKYNNITHIRKLSDDAICDITEKVDFVYIDGQHTYKQVKKDIMNYKNVIKDNGIIGGHDYSINHWKEVINAVNECLGIPDNLYIDSSWIKKL